MQRRGEGVKKIPKFCESHIWMAPMSNWRVDMCHCNRCHCKWGALYILAFLVIQIIRYSDRESSLLLTVTLPWCHRNHTVFCIYSRVRPIVQSADRICRYICRYISAKFYRRYAIYRQIANLSADLSHICIYLDLHRSISRCFSMTC